MDGLDEKENEKEKKKEPVHFIISTPLELEEGDTDKEDEGDDLEGELEEEGGEEEGEDGDPEIEHFEPDDTCEKEYGQVQMEAEWDSEDAWVHHELEVAALRRHAADPFNMFVVDCDGKRHSLLVCTIDTYDGVKAKITDKLGYFPDSGRLVIMGRQFKEGHTLSDYTIQKDGFIHLLGKLDGGGKRARANLNTDEAQFAVLGNDSIAVRRALGFRLSGDGGIKGWIKRLTVSQLGEFVSYIEAYKGSPERVLTYAASMTQEAKDIEDNIFKQCAIVFCFAS